MLEIKTNQLKSRKKVMIDDTLYTVRRLGNLEQLEISQAMRRLKQLAAAEEATALTAEQVEEVDALSVKMSDIFIALFDDGGDQSKSRALLASLSDSEIGELIKQIFEDTNATDQPEVS